MTTTDKAIGARIRTARKMRHRTVEGLASEVAISTSLLEKIERGDRNPTPALIVQLAKALDIGAEHLNGQPYLNGTETEDQVHAVIPQLRRIMLAYDSPEDLVIGVRPLAVLASEVQQVSKMRQDGQYAPIGPLLPGLLNELTHTALETEGDVSERAFWNLALAYRAANSVAHKLGYQDLSIATIERIQWASERSGDPYMPLMAGYLRLGAMLRQGTWKAANLLATELEGKLRSIQGAHWDDTSRGLLGAIVLKRAVMRARQGNADGAMRELEEAAEIAAASGDRDGVFYETSFGPSNLRIHEVHIGMDTNSASWALNRLTDWGDQGAAWEPPVDLPAERRSHHFIDLSAAQLATGDRRQALVSLQKARQIAPNHTRFHPSVRSTAEALQRADRHADDSVTGFARWAGV
ncbi:helix-turn-helix domain-containing protein [Streptacidiphilus sp. N1-12]|uniref:Helix-turn-helix domain-containing protein n=2 Tax=Streptacidiphilus alkalitolerans TaxID=3342712 RepID=A0ABV6V9W8_9ACTN